MTELLVEQLDTALEDTGRLIAGVRTEQWAARTPCTDWDVAAVVEHVTMGNQRFAAALSGAGTADEEASSGSDRLAAYRQSCATLLAACRDPGAGDRLVQVPVGRVPGTVAVHLRIVEALVHGWDIAQATGQAPSSDDGLAEQELGFTRDALRIVPPDRTPFGPPQPVPGSAPAIDRLAGLLGRRPLQ
jgi:uncharacterized protein (TIGR03086 family)